MNHDSTLVIIALLYEFVSKKEVQARVSVVNGKSGEFTGTESSSHNETNRESSTIRRVWFAG